MNAREICTRVLIVLAFVFCNPAFASGDHKLKKIMHGPMVNESMFGKLVFVDQVQADAQGGTVLIHAQGKQSQGVEQYRFTWEFDRVLDTLTNGASFQVHFTAHSAGNSGHEGYARVDGSNGVGHSPLVANEGIQGGTQSSGSTGRVYSADTSAGTVGSKSATLSIANNADRYAHTWFTVRFNIWLRNVGSAVYEVAYLLERDYTGPGPAASSHTPQPTGIHCLKKIISGPTTGKGMFDRYVFVDVVTADARGGSISMHAQGGGSTGVERYEFKWRFDGGLPCLGKSESFTAELTAKSPGNPGHEGYARLDGSTGVGPSLFVTQEGVQGNTQSYGSTGRVYSAPGPSGSIGSNSAKLGLDSSADRYDHTVFTVRVNIWVKGIGSAGYEVAYLLENGYPETDVQHRK